MASEYSHSPSTNSPGLWPAWCGKCVSIIRRASACHRASSSSIFAITPLAKSGLRTISFSRSTSSRITRHLYRGYHTFATHQRVLHAAPRTLEITQGTRQPVFVPAQPARRVRVRQNAVVHPAYHPVAEVKHHAGQTQQRQLHPRVQAFHIIAAPLP